MKVGMYECAEESGNGSSHTNTMSMDAWLESVRWVEVNIDSGLVLFGMDVPHGPDTHRRPSGKSVHIDNVKGRSCFEKIRGRRLKSPGQDGYVVRIEGHFEASMEQEGRKRQSSTIY